jgi:hypothetical protein
LPITTGIAPDMRRNNGVTVTVQRNNVGRLVE